MKNVCGDSSGEGVSDDGGEGCGEGGDEVGDKLSR